MPVIEHSICASGAAPQILMNPIVKHLAGMAQFAYEKQQIVAYSGRTGIGKTQALAWLEANLPVPKVLLRCRAITTKRQILAALALRPGESNGHYLNSVGLYERAARRLRQGRELVIVDEADRLRDDCFELLRDLWDDVRAPLLLVGNQSLDCKIDRQLERLARRIRRFHERDLRPVELRQVLEFMGYRLNEQEFDLIWRHSGGSPGWAEAVLVTADAIAERNKVKRGIEDLAGAAELVPTPRRSERR